MIVLLLCLILLAIVWPEGFGMLLGVALLVAAGAIVIALSIGMFALLSSL